MKKCIYILILILISILCTLLSAQGTPGLAFTLIDNGTAYEVSRGTADTTHVDIPPTHNGLSVTRIAEQGFQSFTTMTSITIPNSVTTIGSFAFAVCISLASVTFESPSSLTTIAYSAFRHCTALASIIIPSSVTTILGNPFTYTPNLENIFVEAGNTHFRCEGNSLIRNSDNTLISGTKNSIIPLCVTSIGLVAFQGCTSLKSITIPSSVTTIRSNAFHGCTSLFIYTEALCQPPGWDSDWNPYNRPVYWGAASDDGVVEMPVQSDLFANYPNPFNPTTTIGFAVTSEGEVSIAIYNLKGQLVRGLVSGVYRSGSYSVTWDGTDDDGRTVSSGIYFYRMLAGEYVSMRRMILLK